MTTKSGIDPAALAGSRLFGLIASVQPAGGFDEDYMTEKVRQAEDSLERDLQLFLKTTRIISEPDGTVVKGVDYDVEEPGYDYDADFFTGEKWGWVKLRHHPVQSVQSMVFAYPNADSRVFTVPTTWIRLDKNFGIVRLVPDKVAVYASFSAYILSIFSGGRGVPQSVLINYTAGFQAGELAANHTDLLEAIKRRALLEILADGFIPQSFSNSADGLSQSISTDLSKLREDDARFVTTYRDHIKGVRMVVV